MKPLVIFHNRSSYSLSILYSAVKSIGNPDNVIDDTLYSTCISSESVDIVKYPIPVGDGCDPDR